MLISCSLQFGFGQEIDSLKSNYIDKTDNDFGKERSDSFYDSLAIRAKQKKWTRGIHDALIRNSASETNNKQIIDPNQRFYEHTGKVIRNIRIRQLDVFGPTITDTARKADHWLEKSGNSLHVHTNKRFVENNLFIAEGERIDPNLISDNERILRNISSIQDVRIYVHSIENTNDSVDLVIITKDVMPYGVSWEIYDVAYGEASIWNTNLLGMGHSLGYRAIYNLNREPKYGYNLKYTINNLSNSFTSLEFQHTNKYQLISTSFRVRRNFITPDTRVGGEFSYANNKKTFTLITIDTVVPDIVSDYEVYDTWLGYSHPAKRWFSNVLRKNYFISGRSIKYNFFERPEVAEDSLYEFQNRHTYLASFGITWQGFHTSRLVYGFGRTEDLPYGAMIKFTGGHDFSQFESRPYFGLQLTGAKFLKNYGYFKASTEFASFYDGHLEQGVINTNVLHITPLLGNSRHKFRNFLSANYSEGINSFNDDFALIDDDEGITGISGNSLIGDKRFYVNNEFVYYSPHYIYGFRLIYFLYADIAMINHANKALINNPAYMSTGLGVRIRNEHLVFNTVQIRLSFFPISPGISEGQKEYINFTSFPEYRMPDFADRRPEVITF